MAITPAPAPTSPGGVARIKIGTPKPGPDVVITNFLKDSTKYADLAKAEFSQAGSTGYAGGVPELLGIANANASAALCTAKSLGWSTETSSTVRNIGHGIKGLTDAAKLLTTPGVSAKRLTETLTEGRNRLNTSIGSIKVDMNHAHKRPAYYPGEAGDGGSSGGTGFDDNWDPITGQAPRATYNEYGDVVYPGGGYGEFSSSSGPMFEG